MFSADTMTPSLPSISTILPFRSELAMTLTVSSRFLAQIRAQHSDPEPDRHIFPQPYAHKDMPELAPAASPFWDPHVHADRRPVLMARARIVAALRSWFTAHDFVEVETGALQVSPGNETHLHAFATALEGPDGASAQFYLRTSPEFACKKLLAAGERRIVEFAKAFRNRERGALHHPDFTLVEWYRAHEPYEALMEDCAAILALAAEAAGAARFSFRDRSIDPFAKPDRLTVAEAFRRHAAIDLMAVLPPHPTASFAAAASEAGV